MTFNYQRSKQLQRGLNRAHQVNFLVISEHKIEKIVGGGEGKRTYPARPCKVCAAHKKQSETRYICEFCAVPLHKGSCFEKYHSVMEFLQSGAQEHNLQC
jgi:hypothetical protein